jgi:transcriptional regulator with XRE-family HTH domain
MAFGERLRLARLRAGLSLAALAEKVTPKVSPQAINKYEICDRGHPRAARETQRAG